MSTLERLKTMQDEEIQNWLRKIGTDNAPALVIALLGADSQVVACVTRNMARYARDTLMRELVKARALDINPRVINQKAAELEKLF